MEDLLISPLETEFGYPVRLQGSLLPSEQYPDNFFTFWNDSADGSGFYSNDETAIVWQYSLNFYSNDPNKVNTILLAAKAKLKSVGFIAHGAGHSVMSDEQTHTGRGISISYRQKL